jgi:hypothetical protein
LGALTHTLPGVAPVSQIAPGLSRWTARHEEWNEDVGSVAVETADGLVFIDPIEPPHALGTPDHVLLTVYWHGRAAAAVGARRVWAPARSTRPLGNRKIAVTDPFEAGDTLPGGIEALQTARSAEVVYWLPDQRTVVAGDVLLGAGARPRPTADVLRLCPERWLGAATHEDLRVTLHPLLALPVERILVSHGEPVLADGGRALAAVLG